MCCHYRSSCLDGEYWSPLPAVLHGASWIGHNQPSAVGDAVVHYSSPPPLFHSTMVAVAETATALGSTQDTPRKTSGESVRNSLQQPGSTRTSSPTRPAPHLFAPLVEGTGNPLGSTMPHDVPQTFAPVGKTSDSDIAKTSGLPDVGHRRLLYRNPISWIRSRKAQLFRERRERQNKSEP